MPNYPIPSTYLHSALDALSQGDNTEALRLISLAVIQLELVRTEPAVIADDPEFDLSCRCWPDGPDGDAACMAECVCYCHDTEPAVVPKDNDDTIAALAVIDALRPSRPTRDFRVQGGEAELRGWRSGNDGDALYQRWIGTR